MNTWQPLTFLEGENEAELRARFVTLTAKHGGRFTPHEVAKFVFRDLPDPNLRAMQAADYWSKDLEVQEQIRILTADGGEVVNTEKARLLAMLMNIAQTAVSDKEKLTAIRTIAEMEGYIVKAVDKKISHSPGSGNGMWRFTVDRDADKPNTSVDDDDDE